MSFHFNWPEFDSSFYEEAKKQLETALNKEKKSKHIADHIIVKELHMGTKPPELEVLEIGELSTDYFRGIFKLTYCGDSYIELQTKVQANPLYNPPLLNHQILLPRYSRPNIVAAAQPLVIPMLLRISNVKLNGIITLSVSKSKGVTLVFKNNALEHLQVSSTFDIVPSVKSYLQQLIETQLRFFLQDTLPIVVHEYSLRHINDHQQQKQQRSALTIYSADTSSSSFQYNIDYCDSPAGINDIPDLTTSDGYSDTSSECFSYTFDDDNDDGHSFYSTSYSLKKGYNCIPPNLSTDNIDPSSVYHHLNNNNNNSNTNNEPVMISTKQPNGLIHRIVDLSHTSHTLALQNNGMASFLVHKTSPIVQFNKDGPRKKTKVPKRRIIKWNS